MRTAGWIIIAAILGSAVFYLPALLLRVLLGPDWTVFSLIPLTFGLPLLLCYVLQRFRRFTGTPVTSTAYAMILGTWILGPPWLGLLMFVSGGGKATLEGLHEMLLFPIYTFMVSTYAGLLGALLLTTILLLVCAAWGGPFRSAAIKKEDEASTRSGSSNRT